MISQESTVLDSHQAKRLMQVCMSVCEIFSPRMIPVLSRKKKCKVSDEKSTIKKGGITCSYSYDDLIMA